LLKSIKLILVLLSCDARKQICQDDNFRFITATKF